MITSTDKCRKRCVDRPKDQSQLTCIIHSAGNSSDECKVLSDFGSKYANIIHTKDHRKEPSLNNKFGKNQENNAIVQHAVDKIIQQEKKHPSVKYETH